jgi:hypothetical protein
MDNVNHNRADASDLRVNSLNPNSMHYSKRLELYARWIPVCQEIADECGRELPHGDRLGKMILSAHYSMCLLADASLEFPDAVTQQRVINQFLMDCFSAYD